jgi:hypothetical protein
MAFIDKGFTNEFRLSSCPQPILPGKHTLNPPIVTVIGAGVAGLTVAHELVERGFLVQVVEATPDPFHPGRPLVGGMAANQPARVRANIEDLHATLLEARKPLKNDDGKKIVIDWLMWIFALNRTRWIPTEDPDAVPRVIIDPTDSSDGATMKTFVKAKKTYRQNWLWDLIVRPFLMGAVTSVPPASSADADRIPTDVIDIFKKWCAEESTVTIVTKLYEHMRAGHKHRENTLWPIKVPTEEQLSAHLTDMVTPAFDREFLCFRLVPRAVPGAQRAEDEARYLFRKWRERFGGNDDLKHCFIDSNEAGQLRKDSDTSDIRVVPAREPVRNDAGKLVTAWLQVEVMEQRIPGEHGYRFFPSSYRHLDDTMKRIPLFDDAGRPTGFTVFDNLRPTVFQGLGMTNKDFEDHGVSVPSFDPKDPAAICVPKQDQEVNKASRVVEIHRNRAKSVEGLRDRTDRFVRRLGGTPRDAALFGLKMLHYMSSCPERRRKEYEKQPWSTFIGLSVDEDKGGFSKGMKLQMEAAAQALLAFSVGEADARTYGDTATQLFLDQLEDGSRVDRTLNGPTSSAWLEPWRVYLQRQGVRFFCRTVTKLDIQDGELVPVFGNADGSPDYWDNDRKEMLVYEKDHPERSPDFYVLALGLPAVAKLLKTIETPDPRAEAAGEVAKVIKLHEIASKRTDYDGTENPVGIRSLKDMTGVQFFFDAKTSIGDGHMYFPFSPWGLSSISQNEFWLSRGGFSDGYLGVLSVDICTTDRDDDTGRSFLETLRPGRSTPAGLDRDDQLTRGSYRVAKSVWDQIKARIDAKDELAEPKCFHLDRAIASGFNSSQYLAATPQLRDRPGRRGGDTCVGKQEISYELFHKRWVMCGTYMATHTRMTTMEAANESGRHAVRAILKVLGNDDSDSERNEQVLVQTVLMQQLLLQFNALGNKTYNTAWSKRKFDPPDVWSPEDYELEDLDLLRRIDRRLLELDLPHFFKILKVEEKLRLAHMTSELYGKDAAEPVDIVSLLGLSASSIDAKMTKEHGQGYAGDAAKRNQQSLKALKDLIEKAKSARFPDMQPPAVDQLLGLVDILKTKQP